MLLLLGHLKMNIDWSPHQQLTNPFEKEKQFLSKKYEFIRTTT